MSISEKLTELTSIRTSMREKLVAKGVDASQHNFKDFPEDIESIVSGGTDGVGVKFAENFATWIIKEA